MSDLLTYLNLLDQDSAAREAHEKDPVGAMTNFGLSASEQAAYLSGDKSLLAKEAGIDESELPAIQVNESAY